MTGNDILQLTNQSASPGAGIVYGTVTGLSGGSPVIVFDGETVASPKKYARLASYTPTVGDRVALIGTSGTHLILGKVVKT